MFPFEKYGEKAVLGILSAEDSLAFPTSVQQSTTNLLFFIALSSEALYITLCASRNHLSLNEFTTDLLKQVV